MNRVFYKALPLALALLLGAGAGAHAEVLDVWGTFGGDASVSSRATGKLTGTYDTDSREFTYRVTYSGLTGPVTVAHIHGPANAGENAGVLVPIPAPYHSGMAGRGVLNASTARNMLAGKTYLNLHTAANPNGEIRAQVQIGAAAAKPAAAAPAAAPAYQPKPSSSSSYGY